VNRYAEQLRDELVDAAVRQHRARRRRRAIVSAGAGFVAVAAVVAIVVGVVVGSDDDTPAAASEAVRATRSDVSTLVEILEPDKPDEVLANLRAIGISAERVERPTGPSKVGTVVSVAVEGESRPSGNTNSLLSVYVDSRAKVSVGVGVPTPEGGLYDIATDAFAPGEPLHCLSWPGQTTDDLAAVVTRASVNVRAIDAQSGPLEELPSGRIVSAATAVAADRVIVMVDDGPSAGPPPECAAGSSTGG
jgi:hypothetical protein